MAKVFSRTKVVLIAIILIASFLRLWNLSSNPPSLFGDELDLGYQAYSILKTGRDYYGNFMPIHFHSLAEWRTPLYLYSAVPTVAIFGISPLGVRLPAAIFGILSIYVFYLLVKQITNYQSLATIASAVLTFSPWHIQYSRAGFEVTLMLLLLLLGLYFFFKSFHNSKFIIHSSICLVLTPWVYSTAKLFTPLLLLFLLLVWWKEIVKIPKKYLIFAIVALVIIGGPIALSTLYGGGSQRFGYISVFSDPTTETEVGVARGIDAKARGESGTGLTPTFFDRVVHNKYTFWGKGIVTNYLKSFSTDFLFVKGDLNLRHSIGIGELYKIELIPLILGLILFSISKIDKRIKLFMFFWLFAGPMPSAITRDGGYHATRLILILPPLIFLISYGLYEGFNLVAKKWKLVFLASYLLLFIVSFVSYQHTYWSHYPFESERWWHAGFKEGIKSIKELQVGFEKVVISSRGEPPWIFFAGWYEYPPKDWQNNFPIGNDIDLPGFGKVSHIDKFYFGSPSGGVYDWGGAVDSKTLYLATAKEVNVNLMQEPERTPGNLTLLKAIAYPSGEPAFYLFTGKK
ncbi:MAG: glycosyltransferase family 39 protein [Candidatus Woesebacteria bacterium]|nr:glycosyltransferase family 39 protein [Candidatus Woesebacteria bacterium]